jgi:putative ABC transport system ATP-binding protein
MGLDASVWERPAHTLSVGQQQRVAAARALVGQPGLVIADEPTSALDEDRRDIFLDLLLSAGAAAGSALVLVSHDRRIAQRFGREVSLPQINRAARAVEGDA